MELIHQPFHGPWVVRKKIPLNMKVGSLIISSIRFHFVQEWMQLSDNNNYYYICSTSLEFLDLFTINFKRVKVLFNQINVFFHPGEL